MDDKLVDERDIQFWRRVLDLFHPDGDVTELSGAAAQLSGLHLGLAIARQNPQSAMDFLARLERLTNAFSEETLDYFLSLAADG